MLHIVTLGVPLTIQRIIKWPKKLWPWFTNSEEHCDKCKNDPQVKGCIKVSQLYKGIVVQHNAEMMDIIVVDQ